MAAGTGRRRAVMHDVARLAGVSHQTVSRVINGNAGVRPETRERVERAMTQLDYRPNALARGLARRRAHTVGVIGFDSRLWGPGSTLIAIQRAAQEAGYGVVVSTLTGSTRGAVRAGMATLADQAVDGALVIAPTAAAAAALGRLPADLPVVALESAFAPQVPTVAVDQRAGARLVTEHLLSLGHRRIAHLSGPPDWNEAVLRHARVQQTLGGAGLEPVVVLAGDWSAGSGHQHAAALLASGATAVVTGNDQMALGLLAACAERHVAVPDRLSVTGFDDMPGSAFFHPALTTVRQDFDEVGRAGLETLIGLIENGARPAGRLIAPELVVRRTTGPPPH